MLWILALAATARAETPALLHPLFQDHAVLQRDRPITVWGHAAGGEVVNVSLESASARAAADGSGRWSAVLPPVSAGGPFVLTAQGSSGNWQAVNDILVGDVYLCSGQSNMELRVQEADDSYNEIHHSSNDTIRLLNIAHAVSPIPLAGFKGPAAWQLAAPATVPDWSAACYFFARELSQSIHAPIGLVQATWGGSNIRPWISAAALQTAGGYERSLETLTLYAKDENAAQKGDVERGLVAYSHDSPITD
jgi:sialate O-acetylesterase